MVELCKNVDRYEVLPSESEQASDFEIVTAAEAQPGTPNATQEISSDRNTAENVEELCKFSISSECGVFKERSMRRYNIKRKLLNIEQLRNNGWRK
jgi:hypothetical protein